MSEPAISAPGTGIAYRRGGAGEPLVLLHGLGSSARMWDPVLDRLTRARDVVTVDLPGHGASPTLPRGVEPTAAELARSVISLLDALGLADAHLAGNSLGGWVALEVARQGRARSVTAISPAGFARGRLERRWSRTTMRTSRVAARAVNRTLPLLVRSGPVRSAMMFSMVAHGSRMPADAALEATRSFASAAGFSDTLTAVHRGRFEGGDEIGCPVTIAWGDHDRLLLLRQLATAAVELPRARLVVLRDCGHMPTWDDPAQVARVLLEGSRPAAG